jgi:hypothetical protein
VTALPPKHVRCSPEFIYFLKLKGTLRAIVPDGFDPNPFEPVTFSSAAKNKVTKKKPLAGLCSSSNYLQDLAGRHNVLPALCDSIYILVNCPTKSQK